MTSAKLNFNNQRGDYGIIQRTIKDRDIWQRSARDKITDLENYSDEEITKLSIVCLKNVQETVRSYMRAKLRDQSFDDWMRDQKNNNRRSSHEPTDGTDGTDGTDDTN